jgi:hypothetical protein
MELDELKQTWNQTPVKKNINTDIMELIQHKSYGPLSALKRVFLKEIKFMIILPVILVMTNANDVRTVLTSVMFWSYVGFCICMIVFSYFNYRTVQKMGGMDEMVRSNLEQQIAILEKRLKWNMVSVRIVMLFFVVLTEVVPYFQHYRMLDKWHSLSPLIRFGAYAGLIILQYIVSRNVARRKFGRHLAYLKDLAKEMQ